MFSVHPKLRKYHRAVDHQRSLILIVVVISILIVYRHVTSRNSEPIAPVSRIRSPDEIPAFIITLPGHEERAQLVMDLYKKYANISAEPFYGVNGRELFGHMKYIEEKFASLKYASVRNKPIMIGERGLRETMRKVFTMAYKENFDRILILEDDSIPHLNFSALFRDLLPRCRQADVLLLGATIWHGSRALWPHGICFDADIRTYGAFAVLVKRVAFVPILAWLEKGRRIPFDHMYTHIQKEGIVVRVAHPPFLAIADIAHKSSINNNRGQFQFDTRRRTRKHDWHLEFYPSFNITD